MKISVEAPVRSIENDHYDGTTTIKVGSELRSLKGIQLIDGDFTIANLSVNEQRKLRLYQKVRVTVEVLDGDTTED